MQDAIFIVVALGFIALSAAYVRGLDRLVGPDSPPQDDAEGGAS